MEDEVKSQKLDDGKIKVAMRLRIRKPVNTKLYIVEMSWAVWREFLFASHKDRLKIALRILDCPNFVQYIEELTWISLGKQNKLQVVDENSIIRV